jgi:hypothetical protein
MESASMRLPALCSLALATLLLSACGGNRPSLNGPPSSSYTSTKPAQAVAQCIVEGWPKAGIKGSKVNTALEPLPNGARATLTLDKTLDQVAIVERQGTGSKTSLWSLGTYFGGKPAMITAVEACQ